MIGPRARHAARVVGFGLLVLATFWLGRETRPDGSQIALAWPAAGVAVWWLASTRSREEAVLAVGVVGAAAAAVNVLTGAPAVLSLVFAVVNSAHAVVGVLALRRLLPGEAAVRAPGDVARVLVASALASAVSASIAGMVAATLLQEDGWATLGLVLVRNTGSTFVVVSAVLALRGSRGPGVSPPRLAELLPAVLVAVGLFVLVFEVGGQAPLLFLGMLVPVWFGTRLGVSATALVGVGLSALTVVFTLLGSGPAAAVDDVQLRAVVVQAYILVLTLVGLSLATLQRAGEEMRVRLEASRRELQEAADASTIGEAVVVRGADGGWTLTRPNPALVRLLGRDPSAMRWRELLFPHDSLVVRAAIDRIADGLDEAWQGEVRHCLPGGGAVWTQLHVSRMPSPTGASAVVAQLVDISERRAAEQERSRQAVHDSLTGLPNRARLHERLDEILADTTAGGDAAGRVAVMVVDLEGFTSVNDAFGDEVGDAVLQAVATAMLAALRPEDVVGRLGGDEFVACCPGLPDPDTAAALVRRVVSTLSPALLVRGRDVGLAPSVGWTLSAPGDDSTELLGRAGEALTSARRAGPGGGPALSPRGGRGPSS